MIVITIPPIWEGNLLQRTRVPLTDSMHDLHVCKAKHKTPQITNFEPLPCSDAVICVLRAGSCSAPLAGLKLERETLLS